MRTRILLLCASAFAGCSALRSAVCGEPPPRVEQSAQCLREPPPAALPVLLDGPEEGCPAHYAGCLTAAAGTALELNVRRRQAWQAEAWARCGPPPSATPDAGRP